VATPPLLMVFDLLYRAAAIKANGLCENAGRGSRS
jgi:hypothetical protein